LGKLAIATAPPGRHSLQTPKEQRPQTLQQAANEQAFAKWQLPAEVEKVINHLLKTSPEFNDLMDKLVRAWKQHLGK
jgi:hypothetical protein